MGAACHVARGGFGAAYVCTGALPTAGLILPAPFFKKGGTMPWIMTADGDLANLDLAKAVEIERLEDGRTATVTLHLSDGVEWVLYTGDVVECCAVVGTIRNVLKEQGQLMIDLSQEGYLSASLEDQRKAGE
jgi:hypothetical protein